MLEMCDGINDSTKSANWELVELDHEMVLFQKMTEECLIINLNK